MNLQPIIAPRRAHQQDFEMGVPHLGIVCVGSWNKIADLDLDESSIQAVEEHDHRPVRECTMRESQRLLHYIALVGPVLDSDESKMEGAIDRVWRSLQIFWTRVSPNVKCNAVFIGS